MGVVSLSPTPAQIDKRLLSTIVDGAPVAAEDAEAAAAAGAPSTLRFRSGNLYSGGLANATTMEGEGHYTWASSGATFEGSFVQNTVSGAGVYTWADGCRYEGQVAAGLRHGVGTFTGKGGFPMYEGEWREGRRHGSGTLRYRPEGDVYVGQWADDVRCGEGTLSHASGNEYRGQWDADQKNGQGVYEWRDRREVYSGEWHDGLPHGHGEHIWLRRQNSHAPFQLRERCAPRPHPPPR